MPEESLVKPLFDGPLDVVGDVHGEIEALGVLLRHLGYSAHGIHPRGRRLVFLGDLTDRGPDSPAVVRLVGPLIERGLAQCVLGNHELNLLLGLRKDGNGWFYGEAAERLDRDGQPVPQAPADGSVRQAALALFRKLPLVLERPDLRVVHACGLPEAIERVRNLSDVAQASRSFKNAIERELRPGVDAGERKLALQNRNPVKVLTSGPEQRTERFYANGKWRDEGRVPWWEHYGPEQPFCVFGHYWRLRMSKDDEGEALFDQSRLYAALGPGRALCLDYSVGKRYRERLAGVQPGSFRTRLAALRWPERLLVFDDGQVAAVE